MTEQELSPKQRIYCEARAEGLTVRAASDRAGVTEDTGTRWNREPLVWARIEELQGTATRGALRILRAKAERAAERVVEIMEPGYNTGNTADVNLRAALSVLKLIGAEPIEKHRLEHTGADGGDIRHTITVERVRYDEEEG